MKTRVATTDVELRAIERGLTLALVIPGQDDLFLSAFVDVGEIIRTTFPEAKNYEVVKLIGYKIVDARTTTGRKRPGVYEVWQARELIITVSSCTIVNEIALRGIPKGHARCILSLLTIVADDYACECLRKLDNHTQAYTSSMGGWTSPKAERGAKALQKEVDSADAYLERFAQAFRDSCVKSETFV